MPSSGCPAKMELGMDGPGAGSFAVIFAVLAVLIALVIAAARADTRKREADAERHNAMLR